MNATKICPGAGKQKRHVCEHTLFSSDRSRTDGMAPYCKDCAAEKQRQWKHNNPVKVREAKKKYRAKEKQEAVS